MYEIIKYKGYNFWHKKNSFYRRCTAQDFHNIFIANTDS